MVMALGDLYFTRWTVLVLLAHIAAAQYTGSANGQTLTVSYMYTCAWLDNNDVKCWGQGNKGQLGSGSTRNVGDAPGEMGDVLPACNFIRCE
jgi:hypothetical protein